MRACGGHTGSPCCSSSWVSRASTTHDGTHVMMTMTAAAMMAVAAVAAVAAMVAAAVAAVAAMVVVGAVAELETGRALRCCGGLGASGCWLTRRWCSGRCCQQTPRLGKVGGRMLLAV